MCDPSWGTALWVLQNCSLLNSARQIDIELTKPEHAEPHPRQKCDCEELIPGPTSRVLQMLNLGQRSPTRLYDLCACLHSPQRKTWFDSFDYSVCVHFWSALKCILLFRNKRASRHKRSIRCGDLASQLGTGNKERLGSCPCSAANQALWPWVSRLYLRS